MELLYLYIESYRSLKNAEFNFGNGISFHYSFERGTVEERFTSPLPAQFWGANIRNLSMIVGDNGSGKTSLMQYIINLLTSIAENDNSQRISINASGNSALIIRHHDEFLLYVNNVDEFNIKWYTDKKGHRIIDIIELNDILQRSKLIFLTNTLSQSDCQRDRMHNHRRFGYLYDCSTGGLIISDNENDPNSEFRGNDARITLDEYFLYEKYKQVKFVFDKRQSKILDELRCHEYPVPTPQKLYIDLLMHIGVSAIRIDEEINKQFRKEFDETTIFSKSYKTIENAYEIKINNYMELFLRYQLCSNCVLCALRSIIRYLKYGNHLTNFIEIYQEQKIKDYIQNEKTVSDDKYKIYYTEFENELDYLWKSLSEFLIKNKLHQESEKSLKEFCDLKKYYVDFIHFIREEEIERYFHIETQEDKFHFIDISKFTFSISTDHDIWFNKFLKKYRYICRPDYFLDFSWGLSSGENSLLSMFSHFYYIFHGDYDLDDNPEYKIYNSIGQNGIITCDSITLLIDEADLSYHPEWQRLYVYLLTEFLAKIYPPSCCKNIQIIITTHSPILLGDIPAQNIIYIKVNPKTKVVETISDESKKTFGQNIHLLLKDSFFLEKGTMGEFAQKKIKLMINDLDIVNKKMINKDEITEMEAKNYLQLFEEEYLPIAKLIGEHIISNKIILKIEECKLKLKDCISDEKFHKLAKLTREEIIAEIAELQQEMERRDNQPNNSGKKGE